MDACYKRRLISDALIPMLLAILQPLNVGLASSLLWDLFHHSPRIQHRYTGMYNVPVCTGAATSSTCRIALFLNTPVAGGIIVLGGRGVAGARARVSIPWEPPQEHIRSTTAAVS